MADPLVARRGPGRPRLPADVPRSSTRSVKLDPALDDQICLLSLRRGVSIHALLKEAVKRFVADERGGVIRT